MTKIEQIGKVISWNCNGAKSNLDEIFGMTDIDDQTIIAIQETKTKAKLKLTNFQTFRNDRKDSNGGGVALFVPNDIPVHKTEAVNIGIMEAISITLSHDNKDITITNIYLPPGNDLKIDEAAFLNKLMDTNAIIVGDFNAHFQEWGAKENSNRAKSIEKIIYTKDMTLLNDGMPTHYPYNKEQKESVLDLIIVGRSIEINNFIVGDIEKSSSDHVALEIHLSKKYEKYKKGNLPKFYVERANWNKFKINLDKNAYDFVDPQNDIDEMATQLKQIIFEAALDSIPNSFLSKKGPKRKIIDKPVCPWWNESINQAIKHRKQMARNNNKNNTLHNYEELEKAKKQVKYLIRKAKEKLWIEFTTGINQFTNSKEVWDKLNRMKGNKPKTGVSRLETNNGFAISDYTKAETLAHHFFNVSSNSSLGQSEINRRYKEEREKFEILIRDKQKEPETVYDQFISIPEVVKALKGKKGTSPGEDGISYPILQNLSSTCLDNLVKLYNIIYDKGQIPAAWKEAIIIPIYKGPDKESWKPASYRPISLTATLGKVLERVITNRLNYFLESNNIYSITQSGFRTGRQTADQILKLDSEVKQGWLAEKDTTAVFLDVEKAYDRTWRSAAVYKCAKIGITGKNLKFIDNFLKDRHFKVRVGSEKSSSRLLENGIPQGAIISPLIFNIMVNDMSTSIEDPNTKISQFADDTAVWYTGDDFRIYEFRFQDDLDNLNEWYKYWGFKINVNKTVLVRFKKRLKNGPKRKKLSFFEPLFNNIKIETKESTRFLGIEMDHELNYSRHLCNVNTSAKLNINILKAMGGKRWGASQKIQILFYKAFIRSKMEYCAPIINSAKPKMKRKLDSIQYNAMKAISKAVQGSATEALEVNLGLEPLKLRRLQLGLTYLTKISAQNSHPLAANLTYHKPMNIQKQSSLQRIQQTAHKLCNPSVDNISSTKPPPWILLEPLVDTEISVSVNKQSDPNVSLQETEKHIKTKYPNHNLIFTDGSKTENGVGAGVFFQDDPPIYIKLDKSNSIFTAEYVAILKALEHLDNQNTSNIKMHAILTDSLSCLQDLRNQDTQGSRIDIRQEILKLYSKLTSNELNITFVWIPSHVGLRGNENADLIAKHSITDGVSTNVGISLGECKAQIRSKMLDMWQTLWEKSSKGRIMFELKNKVTRHPFVTNMKGPINVALTRLRLNKAAFTFKEPECETCKSKNTVEHRLLHCKKFLDIRKPITEALQLENLKLSLKEILNPNAERPVVLAVRHFIAVTNDY